MPLARRTPLEREGGYGNVAGFTLQLQDRSGGSIDNLAAQVQRFVAEASKRPEIGRLTTTFQPTTPQVNIQLDREKARALGVKVDSVFQTLQAYLSGLYVNDIVRFGRVFKIFLQAEPEFTHQPDQIGKFYVRNQDGNMVPLDTLVDVEQTSGPNFVSRFKPLSGRRDYGCARTRRLKKWQRACRANLGTSGLG